MLKKMALAVMATAISATAFAADSTASDQSVQAQIAELKKEIAQLQANQQQAAAQTDTQSSVSSQGEASKRVTVPTNMGQIQNFLFSDIHDNVIPMGMLNSSQFALGLLKQRNAYNDHALVRYHFNRF